MGQLFDSIPEKQIDFIKAQRIFFVGTAAPDGRVNVSPKGMDSFRVINKNEVLWLNLTGSGNETAAHLLENNRMTIMFCAFEGNPLILRLYGQGKAIHPWEEEWEELLAKFPPIPGARQIFSVHVDLVQTSCGMAVPYFDFVENRDDLAKSALKKGPEGLRKYQIKKNTVSLDGKPTGIK